MQKNIKSVKNRDPRLLFINSRFSNLDELYSFAEKKKDEYLGASPFSHTILVSFFDQAKLEEIEKELSSIKEFAYEKKFYGSIKKRGQDDLFKLPPTTKNFLLFLNSHVFVTLLEKLSGIEGLIPDPHYYGGGYHEIETGGFLKMHTDFNWHERLKLDRRINLLIYLNSNWNESWGGDLKLAEKNIKPTVSVSPKINTSVIFSTTDFSFHGHPEPLACPENVRRRSLALYYYSNGRPKSETFRGKKTSTKYRERSGEKFDTPMRKKLILKNNIEKIVGFFR